MSLAYLRTFLEIECFNVISYGASLLSASTKLNQIIHTVNVCNKFTCCTDTAWLKLYTTNISRNRYRKRRQFANVSAEEYIYSLHIYNLVNNPEEFLNPEDTRNADLRLWRF